MKVGVIGCGNISGAYFKAARDFFPGTIEIVAGADRIGSKAEAAAAVWGFEALSVKELLARPEIEIVLNLTTPQSHTEIDLAALEAGKHVYAEKPFGLDRESGRQVMALAAEKGLRVGSAPDTFLGSGHQACRALVDGGIIGRVVNGTAFMMCHGHESWHPDPGFYYLHGGGPLFDMGPYYLTALVDLIGPVRRVAALNNRSAGVRAGLGVNGGRTFPVEVDTHVAAVLEFASGAVVSLITSFDMWQTSGRPRDMELHGLGGSLHIPDPNGFGGEVRFFRAGHSADWETACNVYGYSENSRSIGLADMIFAIQENRPHRASGELAFHVLDVMCAIGESSREGRAVEIASDCSRPAPLSPGLKLGEIR